MHLTDLTIDPSRFPRQDIYPYSIPLLQQRLTLRFNRPVTMFVGENGAGKSTVLNALARRCDIQIWRGTTRTRYQRNPYEDMLHKAMDVTWSRGPVPGSFFASQIFQNFAKILDEWAADDPGVLKYFGGHSLMTLSHGQSLMSFFRSRYKIKGLYFLDEPETALSPKTQVSLLNLLCEISQSDHAQFIIATHSPILMACPDADLISFDRIPPEGIAYKDTPHYRVYRDFMNDPSQFLP